MAVIGGRSGNFLITLCILDEYEIYKGHDKYVIWIKTVFYSKWVDIGFRKNLKSRPKYIESKSRLEVVVLG